MASLHDHEIEEEKPVLVKSRMNLGRVRMHDPTTKQVILIPTPSNDPNDPLNWPKLYRYYVAGLSCYTVFLTLFLSGGPAITIVVSAEYFFGPSHRLLEKHVAKAAYLFTTSALTIGMGNLFWMPFILKYGRRPVYLSAFTCYLATVIWSAVAKSYTSELAARILLGLAAGFADCVVPLTISDLFFLHERGSLMVWYTIANQFGVSFGLVISGLVTMHHSWRVIYYIGIALLGPCLLLLLFTMPETMYVRNNVPASTKASSALDEDLHKEEAHIEVERAGSEPAVPAKKSYLQRHRLYNGTFTKESYLRLFIRPVILLVLPPVLWATLVFSVALGFYVALTSNASLAFEAVYGFQTYQTGLCFISSIIGGFIGIAFGGVMTDKIADFFTARNGGIREPEMRLPSIGVSIVLGPLALILYGVGLQNKLHWIVPTLGFGILNYVIVQSTTVTLVYTIDSYRPIAGEVIVTQMAFKAAFGFLLFFYTNPWIAKSGFVDSTATMAAIFGVVLLFVIPLYFYGSRIRHATLGWKVLKIVRWDEDREIGE